MTLAVDERAGQRATRAEDEQALTHLEKRAEEMLVDGKCGAGSHAMWTWGSAREEHLRPVQLVTGQIETGVLAVCSVKVYATQHGSYEEADGANRYKLWSTDACDREYWRECGPKSKGAPDRCFRRHVTDVPLCELRPPVNFSMVVAGRLPAADGEPAAQLLALPPGVLQRTLVARAADERRFNPNALYRPRS